MPNSKLKHYLVKMVCVDFHLGLLVLLLLELSLATQALSVRLKRFPFVEDELGNNKSDENVPHADE
jgi:hypothetical protein